MSYTSPEEALLTWKVPREKYWTAQINEFLGTFIFAIYATLIGIAAIGLPIILHLARHKLAIVPAVLIAAALVSIVLAGVLTIGGTPPFRHFFTLAGELVFGHVLVAAAFCVGAGIPWRRVGA